MSDAPSDSEVPGPRHGGDYAPSVAERMAIYQRAGGLVTPLLTTVIAFFIGGVVVAATGHNPISTYKGIFEGRVMREFARAEATEDAIMHAATGLVEAA